MPWAKGESGNPHGRPKRETATAEELRRQLAKARGTSRRAIIAALIRAAEDGDVAAIKLVFERTDGPLAQVVTGADGGPLAVLLQWPETRRDADT